MVPVLISSLTLSLRIPRKKGSFLCETLSSHKTKDNSAEDVYVQEISKQYLRILEKYAPLLIK